ncbi:hypothetical protein NECAME_13376 [Necator americanus]|uniref:Uncharacterized protein n=1 Tax=Necator americanus TaxID=51031 RepID=W2SYY2_NECAM|nr:hypothetical protein NECAME_13376 [Necator americanus]ETN73867.1 hypothetical protein NECAME_13376 [Necator americanus]
MIKTNIDDQNIMRLPPNPEPNPRAEKSAVTSTEKVSLCPRPSQCSSSNTELTAGLVLVYKRITSAV